VVGKTLRRRFRLVALFYSVFVITLCQGGARQVEESNSRTRLYATPSPDSPVVALLARSLPFQVIEITDTWVRVKQGDSLGWMMLLKLPPRESLPSSPFVAEGGDPFPRPEVFFKSSYESPRQGLLASWQIGSLIQDSEVLGKMKHPFYRDRYFQYQRRWGMFYYLRTQLFYVRGICLAEFYQGRLQLNLAKRRTFYSAILGDLWPEDVMRQMIRAQPGLLGNEMLFAKGREYFLELAFLF
jgi:hypothetical protein